MRHHRRKIGFNTKLIMDVGLAGLAVRMLPVIINKFFPFDPTLYSVVGAGGTYVAGHFLKKPDLANAGIALGLVEIITPFIEGMISPTGKQTPANLPIKNVPRTPGTPMPPTLVSDYVRIGLNDYVNAPSPQAYDKYAYNYRY